MDINCYSIIFARSQTDLNAAPSHARQHLPFAIGKSSSKCTRNRSIHEPLVARSGGSVIDSHLPLYSIENVIYQCHLLPPTILRYRQLPFASTSCALQIPPVDSRTLYKLSTSYTDLSPPSSFSLLLGLRYLLLR